MDTSLAVPGGRGILHRLGLNRLAVAPARRLLGHRRGPMTARSAFAVLRLIANSCLVGACTGRSAGVLALEDAIDVAGRAAVRVDRIRPVGDQATGFDVVAVVVDRGQLVLGRKRDDQVAMNHRQRAPRQDHAAVRGAREGRNSAFDLAGIEHVDRAQINAERRRHRLERAPLAGPRGYGSIPKCSRVLPPRAAR
jgi:hypothetical protein